GDHDDHWVVGSFDADRLVRYNYIDACAHVRRDMWEQAGPYDESLPYFEDWDLWLSAHEHGWQFEYVPTTFLDYRVRPTSMTDANRSETRRASLFQQVADKHRELFRSRQGVIVAGMLAEREAMTEARDAAQSMLAEVEWARDEVV